MSTATIYFSKNDYRKAMRDPFDPNRCHAVCRRLVATAAKYPSAWYGAHYYAACALLRSERYARTEDEAIEFWRRSFARECNGCDGRDDPPLSRGQALLWDLAVRRVRAMRDAALALKHSMEW